MIILTTLASMTMARLNAGPIEDLATQIKADHNYVLTHPETFDPEALRLMHEAWMSKDMAEREKQVCADRAATQHYYKKFADAEARKWQIETPREPDTVIVSKGGSVSAGRDNTGYAYASGSRSGEVTEIYHKPTQ